MSQGSPWNSKTNSFVGEGKIGSGSLQTTIYLPAIHVTASGHRVSDMSTMAKETTKMSKLDTQTLIHATRVSFGIIVPLSNAR
jgi:hypothetical protein